MALAERRLIAGPRFTDGRIDDVRMILSDIDQTLAPNQSFAPPAARVTQAFHDAKATTLTGVATARQLQKAFPIIHELRPNGLSVISNGAQIYNGETGLMLIERVLPIETTKLVARELQGLGIDHWIQDDGVDHRWRPGDPMVPRERQATANLGTYRKPKNILNPAEGEEAVANYDPKKPFIIVAHNMTPAHATLIQDLVSGYEHEDLTAFIAHEDAETHLLDIFITHKHSNKQYAMEEVAYAKDVPQENVMGIGDGPNDTVLVKNTGIGVAMENGVQATKDVSVYIAPRQEEDGAAIAIEELVLAPRSKTV